ncbi:response regulator [Motilimonas sp. 1_MG-2023]|uniref:response regulator n=1 Tax=Motilimonas sp. 1_MG-2023 TaxID=3062672 RepID=UPI0026E3EE5B|nr:response regulator [Motilimonas sp. 1_MG-2023]MDO6525016.1 response regulator [Motilimonas sp. 1_MG-2023]
MSKSSYTLADFTFLVIEDEAVFREQLAAFLKQRGAIVAKAENGRHGLTLVADLKPDLVLCDLYMPEMNGQEVIKSILRKYPNLPVIVISAASEMVEIEEALRHGAKDYFMKPLQNWLTIEQSILSILKPKLSGFEVLSNKHMADAELMSHMAHFRQDDPASTLLMQELASAKNFDISGFSFRVDSQPLGLLLVHYPLSQHEVCVFVLDVSLFGTEAAVIGVLLKSLLNDSYRQHQSNSHYRLRSPAQMIRFLNDQIHDLALSHPVNAIQCYLDASRHCLTYSNAGFAPPNKLFQYTGMGLGILAGHRYQQDRIALPNLLKLNFTSQLGNVLKLDVSKNESVPL